jgi:integrase
MPAQHRVRPDPASAEDPIVLLPGLVRLSASTLLPIRLHDLRHFAATLAQSLLAGEDIKVVQEQLGHSSVVLTADTYLSVAVELGLKAAAAAARLVLKAGKSPPGGGSVRRRSTPTLPA